MYDADAGIPNRRIESRVRVEMFLNEYVQEQEYRALALNVSEQGLYVQKLSERVIHRGRPIGLEFELPGTNEIIWARAEPRFHSIADDFHLTGVRFTAMARKHARLIRDYLRERRQRRRLESYTLKMLEATRRRQTIAAPPRHPTVPPPIPAFLRARPHN